MPLAKQRNRGRRPRPGVVDRRRWKELTRRSTIRYRFDVTQVAAGGPRMCFFHLALFLSEWRPHFRLLEDAAYNELMMLRWMHFIFGTMWIVVLSFFNLGVPPTRQQREAPVWVKVYPLLMSRAMAWFRWSALVTVL